MLSDSPLNSFLYLLISLPQTQEVVEEVEEASTDKKKKKKKDKET